MTITVLATVGSTGFSSEGLKFDYAIRFRGNIMVTMTDGEVRTAAAWVSPTGRARVLRDALITVERYQIGAVHGSQRSRFGVGPPAGPRATTRASITLDGKLWGIERFARFKGLRFVMGIRSIHVGTPRLPVVAVPNYRSSPTPSSRS